MIDAHAHLTDERFTGLVGTVLDRAVAAGVVRVLTCGDDIASSERALTLARRHSIVRVAVGVHPHRATSCDEAALARLRELARDPSVVAIGEIGIDLSGRSAPLDAQERAFVAQLRLASELDLPVVVHVRDSGDVVRRLLDGAPRVRGQLHCYSEGAAEVAAWVECHFWLSFAGTMTFPANDGLRAAARAVPADRLLAETDAPYLAPEPHRGRRNEPAFVAATYERLAEVRGVTRDDLTRVVAANATTLFGERWR